MSTYKFIIDSYMKLKKNMILFILTFSFIILIGLHYSGQDNGQSYDDQDVQFNVHHHHHQNSCHSTSKTIFIITPTYYRPTQLPDMTRMAQTLMHVKNIFWIVIDESASQSVHIEELLKRTQIPFVYKKIKPLTIQKPKQLSSNPEQLNSKPMIKGQLNLTAKTTTKSRQVKNLLGKGFFGRKFALNWLRENAFDDNGVVYFADDDNTYDIRLFNEMRKTKRISVFPVGLIKLYGVSSPIVNMTSEQVVDFHDWSGGRKFPVDMAGFAVDLQFLLSRNASMINRLTKLEDSFIKSLGVDLNDFEPLANLCTQVLVWHTKTVPSKFPEYKNLKNNNSDTNLVQLYNDILN